MANHHTKAIAMRGFNLSGDGVDVRYQDNKLFLSGGKLPAGGDRAYSGTEIARVDSDIGVSMTVVLLNSSRDGTRYSLHLVVPNIVPSEREVAITGAAIFVRGFGNLVGGEPSVLQDYDVRPLKGITIAS